MASGQYEYFHDVNTKYRQSIIVATSKSPNRKAPLNQSILFNQIESLDLPSSDQAAQERTFPPLPENRREQEDEEITTDVDSKYADERLAAWGETL